MEFCEVRHKPLQLMDNVLDMFVVKQFHLDEDVGSSCSKLFPGLSSTSENQPVLIVACLHSVERLLHRLVAVVLVVQLFHLEAVGEVFKLDVRILLDCQLCVRNCLCKICAQVAEDGFCLSQRPYPKLFHLPMVFSKFAKSLVGIFLRLPHSNLAKLVSYLFHHTDEVKVAHEDASSVINKPPVHLLGSLQLFKLLDKAVIAKDCPGQAKSVGRGARHVLHHLVLHLLQDQVQGFALFWICMKFVVLDHNVVLRCLDHLGHLHFRLSLDICVIDPDQFISRFKGSFLGSWGVVKHLNNVEARTKGCPSPNADADKVPRVFADRHHSRGHCHAPCILIYTSSGFFFHLPPQVHIVTIIHPANSYSVVNLFSCRSESSNK